MYIAIDATAGERERGSLEPLLLQPVHARVLVLGKWLSTVVFGLIGGMLTLLCLSLAMHQLPLENLGLRLVLGVSESVQLMYIAMPLILFAGAAQLLLATIAKSFKEAQTYLSATMLLPMLPGLFASMKPMEPSLWMAAVPRFGSASDDQYGASRRDGWPWILGDIDRCLLCTDRCLFVDHDPCAEF